MKLTLKDLYTRFVWMATQLPFKPFISCDPQVWLNARSTGITLNVCKQIGFTPDMLIDVGANHSQWADHIIRAHPECTLISVEPYMKMMPKGVVYRKAIGTLQHKTFTLGGHEEVHVKPEELSIVTGKYFMRNFIPSYDMNAMLKLDVDASTADALESFEQEINRFTVCVIEVCGDDNQEMYRNQYMRIHKFMAANGFDRATCVDANYLTCQIGYCDIIFWKSIT